MNKSQNLELKEVLEIKVKNLTKFSDFINDSKFLLIKPGFFHYACEPLCGQNTCPLSNFSRKQLIKLKNQIYNIHVKKDYHCMLNTMFTNNVSYYFLSIYLSI